MKSLLCIVLVVFVAQVFPSCQQGQEVVGWVEEKFVSRSSGGPEYIIVINTVWYDVPYSFWAEVHVGDLVKYDGTQWTVVKKAGE
jgi:hypothetical protein